MSGLLQQQQQQQLGGGKEGGIKKNRNEIEDEKEGSCNSY